MDKKIINDDVLIRNSMGCMNRYVLEQNAEYTIIYCILHNKEISQHGYDCMSCEYNPYYKNKNILKGGERDD